MVKHISYDGQLEDADYLDESARLALQNKFTGNVSQREDAGTLRGVSTIKLASSLNNTADTSHTEITPEIVGFGEIPTREIANFLFLRKGEHFKIKGDSKEVWFDNGRYFTKDLNGSDAVSRPLIQREFINIAKANLFVIASESPMNPIKLQEETESLEDIVPQNTSEKDSAHAIKIPVQGEGAIPTGIEELLNDSSAPEAHQLDLEEETTAKLNQEAMTGRFKHGEEMIVNLKTHLQEKFQNKSEQVFVDKIIRLVEEISTGTTTIKNLQSMPYLKVLKEKQPEIYAHIADTVGSLYYHTLSPEDKDVYKKNMIASVHAMEQKGIFVDDAMEQFNLSQSSKMSHALKSSIREWIQEKYDSRLQKRQSEAVVKDVTTEQSQEQHAKDKSVNNTLEQQENAFDIFYKKLQQNKKLTSGSKPISIQRVIDSLELNRNGVVDSYWEILSNDHFTVYKQARDLIASEKAKSSKSSKNTEIPIELTDNNESLPTKNTNEYTLPPEPLAYEVKPDNTKTSFDIDYFEKKNQSEVPTIEASTKATETSPEEKALEVQMERLHKALVEARTAYVEIEYRQETAWAKMVGYFGKTVPREEDPDVITLKNEYQSARTEYLSARLELVRLQSSDIKNDFTETLKEFEMEEGVSLYDARVNAMMSPEMQQRFNAFKGLQQLSFERQSLQDALLKNKEEMIASIESSQNPLENNVIETVYVIRQATIDRIGLKTAHEFEALLEKLPKEQVITDRTKALFLALVLSLNPSNTTIDTLTRSIDDTLKISNTSTLEAAPVKKENNYPEKGALNSQRTHVSRTRLSEVPQQITFVPVNEPQVTENTLPVTEAIAPIAVDTPTDLLNGIQNEKLNQILDIKDGNTIAGVLRESLQGTGLHPLTVWKNYEQSASKSNPFFVSDRLTMPGAQVILENGQIKDIVDKQGAISQMLRNFSGNNHAVWNTMKNMTLEQVQQDQSGKFTQAEDLLTKYKDFLGNDMPVIDTQTTVKDVAKAIARAYFQHEKW